MDITKEYLLEQLNKLEGQYNSLQFELETLQHKMYRLDKQMIDNKSIREGIKKIIDGEL